MPGDWNGALVVWAHGYVSPFEPLHLPDDKVEGTPISDIVLNLHFAYATTSYRSNGLAAVDGSRDVEDLLALFRTMIGTPARAYLVGASEGSLSSILALERPSTKFDGGLAVCGPIGYFRGQVDYFGDFRVLFDYFFPGVLPASPIDIPQDLIAHWEDIYAPKVIQAITLNPSATQQLLQVSHAPIDPNDPTTVGTTVLGILWYNVFATNEAKQRLGGNPYDNRRRLYFGSTNDFLLNLNVERFSATPTALAHLAAFETSGRLQQPVVSLHTTGDPIIPFWQQSLYQVKWLLAPHEASFVGFPVARYGHCSFTESEVLAGFSLLVLETTGGNLAVPGSVFPNRSAESRFLELARSHGANPSVIR
ncbi:MAG TPA: hypothetical protein VLN49_02215 [Gemmatimonadaceae bacterium]|nr:hypothetical protein [Gemmatimonadaceae bacterium]